MAVSCSLAEVSCASNLNLKSCKDRLLGTTRKKKNSHTRKKFKLLKDKVDNIEIVKRISVGCWGICL